MKTIVLDDDPTGTQSATGVDVLLAWDADILTAALRRSGSVYVLTNTRAIPEDDAVALLESIKADAAIAAERLGEDIRFVLRGDSTLRGHVFPETNVFADDTAVIVFVPAFPDGGRTTVAGTHYVRVGDSTVPAHETEYADDPVFGFSTGYLPDYVAEKSGRPSVLVGLDDVRSGATALRAALRGSAAGTVILPDAETLDDVRAIASVVADAWRDGVNVVVRSASPLAAALAGVESVGLLPTPLLDAGRPTLLICGSHTMGATRQLEAVEEIHGASVVITTADALGAPVEAGQHCATEAGRRLDSDGFAAIASDRVRDAGHNTLQHGERVMLALTTATQMLRTKADVIIAKGGITSADVARIGLGAKTARVLGQVLPGVSAWSLTTPQGDEKLYIVVPGNVGDPETLVQVLDAVGR